MDQYSSWIQERFPTQEAAHCRCEQATRDMVEAFPELERVRGHYHDPMHGMRRQHWWCVAPDGTIVDPTARQFADAGLFGEYEPLDPNEPTPIGRCMECGQLRYEGSPPPFCSKECEKDYVAAVGPEW